MGHIVTNIRLLLVVVVLLASTAFGIVAPQMASAVSYDPRASIHFNDSTGAVTFNNTRSSTKVCYRWYIGSTYKGSVCVGARKSTIKWFTVKPNQVVKVLTGRSTVQAKGVSNCRLYNKSSYYGNDYNPCASLAITRKGTARWEYNTRRSMFDRVEFNTYVGHTGYRTMIGRSDDKDMSDGDNGVAISHTQQYGTRTGVKGRYLNTTYRYRVSDQEGRFHTEYRHVEMKIP